MGPDPHEVIASSDGKTAYVSNMGGGFHEMNVIDIIAQKALPNIDTKSFIGLHGLVFVGERFGSPRRAQNRSVAWTPQQKKLIGVWAPVRIERT